MRIFKFGGASVKDAQGVKNVVKVLQEIGYSETLIVVSAMGKTTNKLELVVKNYFNDKESLLLSIQEVIDCHTEIIDNLFVNKQHQIHTDVKGLFDEMKSFLNWNKSPNYSFVYDQIVSYGELISTTIISAYLNEIGIHNSWVDARKFIKTDVKYRDAGVDWKKTQLAINEQINTKALNITQGFIGSDDNNFTTTLGREGSDYSAAIFAYCLNATNVTIWKDVPGVLNADPRYFEKNTTLASNII